MRLFLRIHTQEVIGRSPMSETAGSGGLHSPISQLTAHVDIALSRSRSSLSGQNRDNASVGLLLRTDLRTDLDILTPFQSSHDLGYVGV
jgi:hypothetical protein